MGYIRHHAIAITSFSDIFIKEAHDTAKLIFSFGVSEIVRDSINGYSTFFIAPDGSKEGWDESDVGDKCRASFIEFINSKAYEDGSNCLSFCEFYYGDDNGYSEVVSHN